MGVEHSGTTPAGSSSAAGDPGAEALDRWRSAVCARCGLVVGVYEPLVLRLDGITRLTSIAAEPGVVSLGGEVYHRACYDGLTTGEHQREAGASDRVS